MGTLNRESCRKCINSARSTVGKLSYFSAVLTIAFLFFLSVLPFASALLFYYFIFPSSGEILPLLVNPVYSKAITEARRITV